MVSIGNIGKVIEEITNEIENMNSNKNIQDNISKYNTNKERIEECKNFLNNLNYEIGEDTNSESEEIISDKDYKKFMDELEQNYNYLENPLKLNEYIENYKKNMDMINKCKVYLENQNMKISNLD